MEEHARRGCSEMGLRQTWWTCALESKSRHPVERRVAVVRLKPGDCGLGHPHPVRDVLLGQPLIAPELNEPAQQRAIVIHELGRAPHRGRAGIDAEQLFKRVHRF